MKKQNETPKNPQNSSINTTILNIPLITDKIISHCTTKMLLKLILISKYCRLIFLPYLYQREFVFKTNGTQSLPTATHTGFLAWISTHGSYHSNVSTIH